MKLLCGLYRPSGGEIVQTGNHESLIADKTGRYHELWEAQAQYYVQAGTTGK